MVRRRHECDLRTGTGRICRRRFVTARSLQMHKVKGHTGAQRGSPYVCSICPVGCGNEKSFRAHTKRKHPEIATPPALVEGATVIPYKPGVAIFMGVSRGLGYPVAICVEMSTDVNLAPGELSFAAGQFDDPARQAISNAADQARTLFAQRHPAIQNILVTHPIFVSRSPHGLTEGPSLSAGAFAAFFSLMINRCVRMNVAFSGRIGLEGQVQYVSKIVDKVVGMSDFGLRKVIVPDGNRDELLRHEYQHEGDFRGIDKVFCRSCLAILNAGIF